jgi:hypothetical protein
MIRISLFLALLLPVIGGALTSVWESTGPSSDPWGSPNGQSPPPAADTGPDADPWG